jgi:hypothetical protein
MHYSCFCDAKAWITAPCGSKERRCFGGTYHIHLQDRRVGEALLVACLLVSSSAYS